MSDISLRTTVTSLEVTGGGYNAVDVYIDGLDTDDVFKEIAIQDVIDAYGEKDLLEAIGEDAAREYWNIKEGEQAQGGDGDLEAIARAERQARQQIQAALDWIIGDDETPTDAYSQPGMYEINERNKKNAIRNQLRADQRKRLNEFCGKEQG